MTTAFDLESTAAYLERLLSDSGLQPLPSSVLDQFTRYLALILRWNARMNLTAIRDPREILRRHFLESIAAAQALPPGLHSLLDLGSGAGFPGIPIALCRPEIAVILAESQNKKAAFLREAVRSLGLDSRVFAGRAETLKEQFDCVALRAVERMGEAIAVAAHLASPSAWLAIMTTSAELASVQAATPDFRWIDSIPVPGSEQRILALGRKIVAIG